MSEYKQLLFTAKGVYVTIVHDLVALGVIMALLFWAMQVEGWQVGIQLPDISYPVSATTRHK